MGWFPASWAVLLGLTNGFYYHLSQSFFLPKCNWRLSKTQRYAHWHTQTRWHACMHTFIHINTHTHTHTHTPTRIFIHIKYTVALLLRLVFLPHYPKNSTNKQCKVLVCESFPCMKINTLSDSDSFSARGWKRHRADDSPGRPHLLPAMRTTDDKNACWSCW